MEKKVSRCGRSVEPSNSRTKTSGDYDDRLNPDKTIHRVQNRLAKIG